MLYLPTLPSDSDVQSQWRVAPPFYGFGRIADILAQSCDVRIVHVPVIRSNVGDVASWHIRDAPGHFLNVRKSPGSGHAALAAVIPAKAGTSGRCREVPAFAGMTGSSRG